jgi:hypothetical protein
VLSDDLVLLVLDWLSPDGRQHVMLLVSHLRLLLESSLGGHVWPGTAAGATCW